MTWTRNLVFCSLCAALVAFACRPAVAVPLSDLTSGGTITSGPFEFSNFTYTIDSGATPEAEDVNVNVIAYGADQPGIQLQAGFADLAGGDTFAATVMFEVHAAFGSAVTGVQLNGNPAVVGGTGTASVTETITTLGGDPLAELMIQAGAGTSTLSSGALLSEPHTSLKVSKRIVLSAETGLATISFVDQTYTVGVPEPASLAMALSGLFGLGFIRRRS